MVLNSVLEFGPWRRQNGRHIGKGEVAILVRGGCHIGEGRLPYWTLEAAILEKRTVVVVKRRIHFGEERQPYWQKEVLLY
jgi:hypothetical protein